MRTHVLVLSALLALTVVGSSGCLVAAVGVGAAGTVAYMAGDLETQISEDLDTLYAASQKALESLDLNLIEGKGGKDALSATLVARDVQDKKVHIKMTAVTNELTELSIRVGVFGDETKSQLIYQEILKNLPESG
jgi:hypothetical protein